MRKYSWNINLSRDVSGCSRRASIWHGAGSCSRLITRVILSLSCFWLLFFFSVLLEMEYGNNSRSPRRSQLSAALPYRPGYCVERVRQARCNSWANDSVKDFQSIVTAKYVWWSWAFFWCSFLVLGRKNIIRGYSHQPKVRDPRFAKVIFRDLISSCVRTYSFLLSSSQIKMCLFSNQLIHKWSLPINSVSS